MKIGYVRVSSKGQNTIRQELLMQELGVEKVYIDKASGKNTINRKELNEMLDYVREGDVVVVESISRFARNTKDLLELIEILEKKKVSFISKKEKIDTSTSQGRFMLTVFGAMAELERSYILDRQDEGIKAMPIDEKTGKKYSLKTGRSTGRPNAKYPNNWEQEYNLWKEGTQTAKVTMENLNLKRTTFYKLVKQYEEINSEETTVTTKKYKDPYNKDLNKLSIKELKQRISLKERIIKEQQVKKSSGIYKEYEILVNRLNELEG